VIRFTERAREVLAAAEQAARRFDPEARVRLRRTPEGGVTFELTDAAGPGDEVVDGEGFSLVVERGLEGTVDAADHDVLRLTTDAPDP
jgi:hypothetical protein